MAKKNSNKVFLGIAALLGLLYFATGKCSNKVAKMSELPGWNPNYFFGFLLQSVKKLKDADAYNVGAQINAAIKHVDTYPNVLIDILFYVRDQVELSQISLAYEQKFKSRMLLDLVTNVPESVLCTIAEKLSTIPNFTKL